MQAKYESLTSIAGTKASNTEVLAELSEAAKKSYLDRTTFYQWGDENGVLTYTGTRGQSCLFRGGSKDEGTKTVQ